MTPSILVVSPLDRSPPKLEGRLHHLRFQFKDSGVKGAFSASYDSREECFNLLTTCKPMTGCFLEQGLNRSLAESIFEVRPTVVYVVGLYGCTWDLLRICRWLDIECYWQLGNDDLNRLPRQEDPSAQLIDQVLSKARAVVLEPGLEADDLGEYRHSVPRFESMEGISATLNRHQAPRSGAEQNFDYTLYEVLQRDHTLLYRQQAARATLFEGCQRVLDLGCGVGIFLALLRSRGIAAEGVERNADLVEYAREMGLTVHLRDALEFLQTSTQTYDGIYCSHFVEHLPFTVVETLIQQAAAALVPGGILVLAFPDPESIRSQLLGFWRDPEHVRFYHPQLITTLAKAAGLQCEWSSYDDQPHQIIPFPTAMPALPVPSKMPPGSPSKTGFWQQCLAKFGLVTNAAHQAQHETILQRLAEQDRFNRRLVERLESLWAVNATWGWNDDVTLKLRKQI